MGKKLNEENKEKALKLALENNFVTDITSLVVVRPDDKPTIASLEDPFTSPSSTSFAGALRGSVNNLAFSPQANVIALHSIIQSKPSLQARRTTMRNTFKTTTTTFRTTSTYPPFKVSSTYQIFDDEEYFEEKVSSENGTYTQSPIVNCSGNLTLFSKTY